MNTYQKHQPKIIVRRRLTPADTNPVLAEDGLMQVIADITRGRTSGLRRYFENHCRNPQAMRPRTLWYLYLLKCKYREDGTGFFDTRLAALDELLSSVPAAIKAQVRPPEKFDPTAFQT